MTLGKRILKMAWVQRLLVRLGALYLGAVYRTTRWLNIQPPRTRDLVERGGPFIACFWHGRMVMMPAAMPRKARFNLLVSGHRDGRLISQAAAHLGVETVTASSKGGSVGAMRAMQRLLEAGQSIAVTPDGPRGPRMRAKLGAIKTAQMSGAAIVPLSATVSHRRILQSWDRFCVALPFGHGVIFWGDPIYVPQDADADALEALRLKLEDSLNALTREADRHFGQPEIEPAAHGEKSRGSRHARA